MINYTIVFKVVSRILFIIATALLACICIALAYSEPILPFLLSALIALTIGFVLFIYTWRKDQDMVIQKRDAYVTVSLSWLIIAIIGCLPYLLSRSIPQVIDAFFESISGFTTTGSSILNNIEILPRSILFWRSLTHWIGGIGIILIFIIVMPSFQIGGYNLFTLESSLQEKIQPRIKSVGYRLLWIYLMLTFLETILLLLGKMNLFESVCHAFGTVATGGFSPRNTSIAEYSPYIQYIIMIFMVLAGTNFIIHYYAVKREFKKIKENEEVRFYLTLIGIIGLVVSVSLFFRMGLPLEESFRKGFFQVISIITCTGYSTSDYLLWPQFVWMIIFFSMFLGGSTGSTAGGVKMVRYLIMLKNIKRIGKLLLSPNAVIPVRLNRKPVDETTNSSILSFVSIYFLVFLAGTAIMTFLGIDVRTASGSVATCMAGIGPGIGLVGPASNFSQLPDTAKIFLSILMLMGRLEIYTIILLFNRSFWKK
jgi:trk system potassium uptake protein TrkH